MSQFTENPSCFIKHNKMTKKQLYTFHFIQIVAICEILSDKCSALVKVRTHFRHVLRGETMSPYRCNLIQLTGIILPLIFLANDFSQAYILTSFIAVIISLINLTLSSVIGIAFFLILNITFDSNTFEHQNTKS